MTPEIHAVSRLLGGEVLALDKLHGDGSDRAYYRVRTGEGTLILLAGHDRAENDAWVRLAAHLAGAGVRVPRVHAYDAAAGWVLMEDLGETNLHSLAVASADPFPLYAEVLELLARMQIEGAKGFTLEVGFSPTPYDEAVMVGEEGLYFVREFAVGLLGLEADAAALEREFAAMAARAAKAKGGYFLHRDFQSRNIHRVGDGWAVIDFQGARPGPLAYDAAALILDPYVALPRATREALLELYVKLAQRRGADGADFARSWPLVASFRLLQALGAFAKLGGRFGKRGFLEHASAAYRHLGELMEDPALRPYAGVRALVAEATEKWNSRP